MSYSKTKIITFLLLFSFVVSGRAQGLLDQMDDLIPPEEVEEGKKPEVIREIFGGTHVINGESVETIDKKVFSFIIAHRFGRLNGGIYEFFGLDQANIRITMEYGILDNLTIGIARSNFEKTVDGYVKYRFLDQREKGFPLSITFVGDIAISTLRNPEPEREYFFSNRVSYANQLLIARKFHEYFSFQLSPTVVHQNLVETKADPNTLFSLGLGAKIKLYKRLSLTAEYFARIKDNKDGPNKDAFALGLDLVTGGHVFQFQFTNASAMFTQGFVRKTTGNFFKGDVHFGFNISRTFGIGGGKKKKKNQEEREES